jgi:O-antigen/teichoic acid export membrane protein
MLLNIFLARIMGLEPYGLYALAISWLAIPVMVGRGGFDTAVIKLVSAYETLQQWGSLRGLILGSRILVLFASGLVTALVFGGLWAAQTRISPEVKLVLVIAFAGIILGAQCNLTQSCLIGLKKPAMGQISEPLCRSLALIVLAAVWFFTIGQVTGPVAVSLHLLSLGLALALALVLLHRSFPALALRGQREYHVREWLAIALPALVVNLSLALVNQAGTLMVGFYLSPKEVGLFVAAVRLATLVTFVLSASNFIAMPTISALYAQGEKAALQRLATLYCRVMLLLAAPIVLVLVFGGRWLLALFGPEFTAAQRTLGILAAGQAVNAVTGPVGFFLTMTGHQNVMAWTMAVMALANIGANLWLIPRMGINGAAIATALTTAAANIWLVWLVRKRIGVRVSVF